MYYNSQPQFPKTKCSVCTFLGHFRGFDIYLHVSSEEHEEKLFVAHYGQEPNEYCTVDPAVMVQVITSLDRNSRPEHKAIARALALAYLTQTFKG